MATRTIDQLADAEGIQPKLKASSNQAAKMQVLRYLTDDEYTAWDDLVDVSPQGSVFSRSWWVKAVNARVLGFFKSGRLIAGIPLYYERRMGIKICGLPKLTQTFGVVMEPLSGKRVNMMNREMEILGIFAKYLTKEKVFYQCFHPNSSNWLPFLWHRFRQTSRFTYVLDDLSNLDAIWDGIGIRIAGRSAEGSNLWNRGATMQCRYSFRTKRENFCPAGICKSFQQRLSRTVS